MTSLPCAVRRSWTASPMPRWSWQKDCVYSTDSTAQVRFTFSCLSANEVAGCDLLVPGDDPAIVKEGMLNDL